MPKRFAGAACARGERHVEAAQPERRVPAAHRPGTARVSARATERMKGFFQWNSSGKSCDSRRFDGAPTYPALSPSEGERVPGGRVRGTHALRLHSISPPSEG